MTPQLSLDFASAQGERAMRRAQLHAEHDQPGFTSRAAGHILATLRREGPLPGEDLTDRAIAAGHNPPDARAFGPVFKLLLKLGKIRQCGWCERRKGHGTGGGRVWEAIRA